MLQLIDRCREACAQEVLALPDVAERASLFQAHRERFEAQLHRCTRLQGQVAVVDLRGEETIYAGNRFMVYALFPQCKLSMHVMWGLRQQNTVFAIGKSILDRSSTVNVGAVCLARGGGGHEAAGTCQVANSDAEAAKAELTVILSGERPVLAA